MRKRLLLFALTFVAALGAVACSGGNGAAPGDGGTDMGVMEMGEGPVIHVAGAWARSPMPDVAAVYFRAHNGWTEEDRLIGVSSPAAGRAEIHETVMEAGQAKMQPVEFVAIAPDQEIRFEPGGYHVMLFDLVEPLEVGSTISAVLTFEKAGDVAVEAIVKAEVSDAGGEEM